MWFEYDPATYRSYPPPDIPSCFFPENDDPETDDDLGIAQNKRFFWGSRHLQWSQPKR